MPEFEEGACSFHFKERLHSALLFKDYIEGTVTDASSCTLATAAAAAAPPPMPTRIAPRAAPPITPDDEAPLALAATGTHRTPRCVTTGVTAASAPSAEETPSGVLTATFTPAGVLTTALPSIRSPPISPSVKRNTNLDPDMSSMRPNLPRLISALLPLAQATAILLSVNTVVPVMALLSLTVTEPVTINWPTCCVFPFISAFEFFVFLAARVEPVLKAPKEPSANDSRVTVNLRALGEWSDI